MNNSFYAALALIIPGLGCAMVPVIDVQEIAQTGQVVNRLHDEISTLKQQYQSLQRQYQSITGHYGWGTFENSLSQLQRTREWSPSNWQNALSGMAGGNPARYQQLLNEYKQNHRTLSKTDYQKGSNPELANSYANQVKTNQTSATQASYEFNQINQHLKTLYQLSKSIESSGADDMKAAIDLNSRIEIEIGFISIAELRMQTLLNEQAANQSAVKINQETEAAEFNQAGEGS